LVQPAGELGQRTRLLDALLRLLVPVPGELLALLGNIWLNACSAACRY
jgi:hypothetical protein